jgi:hypothetical protein
VLLLASLSTSVRADIQDVSGGEWAVAGLVAGAAVATSVVNIVQISQGDGSKLWGWAGLLIGGGIVAVFAADNGDAWGYVAGGLVAGLGAWSCILSTTKPANLELGTGVRLNPTISFSPEHRLHAGLTLAVDCGF